MIISIVSLYSIGFCFSLSKSSMGDLGGLFVIVLVSIAVLADLARVPKQHRLTLIGGYFFRLLLLIWDRFFSFIYNLPNSGADSGMYHWTAQYIAEGVISGSNNYYSRFLASLYRLYGPCQILGQYLNLLLGMWMIVILIRCFQKLQISDCSAAVKFAAFLPNVAIMNVITLRETPIMFVLALSLYSFIKWYKDGNILSLGLAFALTLVASVFHGGSIAPAGGYALFVMFYDRRKHKMEFKVSTVFFGVVFIVGFLFLYTSYGDTLFGKISDVDIEEMVAGQGSSGGGSGYSVGINTGNSTASFILSTPIRMVYFLFSPFPWQWRGLSDIIAFVFSSCFYAWSLFAGFRVIRRTDHTDERRIMADFALLMIFCSSVIFGWGVSNVGTACRHRDKFVAQTLLLFGVGRSEPLSEAARKVIP